MPHVPFMMPSACHSTSHCQQMNTGLYILSLLSLTDAGENEVTILHLSPDAIIGSIHNVDENISINNVGECVCFYKDFIKEFK